MKGGWARGQKESRLKTVKRWGGDPDGGRWWIGGKRRSLWKMRKRHLLWK
jgi:hypothetical protein